VRGNVRVKIFIALNNSSAPPFLLARLASGSQRRRVNTADRFDRNESRDSRLDGVPRLSMRRDLCATDDAHTISSRKLHSARRIRRRIRRRRNSLLSFTHSCKWRMAGASLARGAIQKFIARVHLNLEYFPILANVTNERTSRLHGTALLYSLRAFARPAARFAHISQRDVDEQRALVIKTRNIYNSTRPSAGKERELRGEFREGKRESPRPRFALSRGLRARVN